MNLEDPDGDGSLGTTQQIAPFSLQQGETKNAQLEQELCVGIYRNAQGVEGGAQHRLEGHPSAGSHGVVAEPERELPFTLALFPHSQQAASCQDSQIPSARPCCSGAG